MGNEGVIHVFFAQSPSPWGHGAIVQRTLRMRISHGGLSAHGG